MQRFVPLGMSLGYVPWVWPLGMARGTGWTRREGMGGKGVVVVEGSDGGVCNDARLTNIVVFIKGNEMGKD